MGKNSKRYLAGTGRGSRGHATFLGLGMAGEEKRQESAEAKGDKATGRGGRNTSNVRSRLWPNGGKQRAKSLKKGAGT